MVHKSSGQSLRIAQCRVGRSGGDAVDHAGRKGDIPLDPLRQIGAGRKREPDNPPAQERAIMREVVVAKDSKWPGPICPSSPQCRDEKTEHASRSIK